MASRETLEWLEVRGLPRTVVARLAEIADWARPLGAAIVVFGSFAVGCNRPTSDLDLGVIAAEGSGRDLTPRIRSRLDTLPTVRRIDLVDLSTVSPGFRQVALNHARPL